MIKYCKVRDVPDPVRANLTDAGIDFFVPFGITEEELRLKNETICSELDRPWVPVANEEGVVTKIILEKNCRVLIPSGIHVKLPNNHALIAFNKSGVAHKKGLIAGSCVVDEGYQGEVHISVINTSGDRVYICPGDKLMQFICLPINNSQAVPVDDLKDLYDGTSTRGDGGFGSSGDTVYTRHSFSPEDLKEKDESEG